MGAAAEPPVAWQQVLAAVTDEIAVDEVRGDANPDIAWIRHDSRLVERGDVFVCIPGQLVDGHDFAAAAIEAGAAALITQRPLRVAVPQLICADPRRAMAHAAATLADHPSREVSVVGVTGTNGKTTVVTQLAAVLAALGENVRIIGTLTGQRTTPEANEVQAMLRDALDAGAQRVLMEVSSHALDMGRVDGTEFEVVVFTNLSVDHLDYHGNMEAYFAAKSKLFDVGFAPTAVIDVSTPHGRLLADTTNQQVVRTEPTGVMHAAADRLVLDWRGHRVEVRVGGSFNVANLTLVAETAMALGFPTEDVANALQSVEQVPGRFEAVDEGQDFGVVVDYAHTPEGLEAVLAAGREVLDDAQLIVVFGCGGDRDRTKRPQMGAIAEAKADVVIVTSDNPRSEDQLAIISDIVEGMRTSPSLVEPDRRRAIRAAIEQARPSDLVIIAGKGHESTQTIGDNVLAFDDRAVARELLRERGQTEVVSA